MLSCIALLFGTAARNVTRFMASTFNIVAEIQLLYEYLNLQSGC